MRDEVAKRRYSWLWLLLALLLAVFAPTMATAQGSGTAQKLEAIRARMEKGQALFVGGDLEGAAKVFDEGYRSHPYSAFLFNAGVCYQKLSRVDEALQRFQEYVRIDPNAPDLAQVKERIARLEAAKAAAAAPPEGLEAGVADAGVAEAGVADAAVAPEAGVAADAGAAAVEVPGTEAMKSLVVIETKPPGAPLRLYQRSQATAGAFQLGAQNPGWTQVFETRSPASLTLAVGHYHVVVDKFRHFNVSQANIDVSPGRVLHFQANLSQGAFMGFLRVSASIRGAYVYLDDEAKQRPAWGLTPHGELVAAGQHTVLVEAPGFEPQRTKVELGTSENQELSVALIRVGYGILRVDGNAPVVKVRVDDKPVGVWRSGEPPLEVKLQSGKKRLTITSPGRKTYEGVVDVPRGQVLPVRAKMVPTYPRGAAWTQAIIGTVVVGAAVFFGLESDRLYDELEEDRRAGVLEEEDSRITRGQIYSVGADVGFVVGGVLGILATYNFLKDPLPESSKEADKPVEFDDPHRARPTARATPPPPATHRRAQRTRRARRPALSFGPSVGNHGGGLLVGGTF